MNLTLIPDETLSSDFSVEPLQPSPRDRATSQRQSGLDLSQTDTGVVAETIQQVVESSVQGDRSQILGQTFGWIGDNGPSGLLSRLSGTDANRSVSDDSGDALTSTPDAAVSPGQDLLMGCSCSQCCGSLMPDFSHLVSGTNSSNAVATNAFGPVSTAIPVGDSGDEQIDALLMGRKWETTTITYSFFDGGTYYGREIATEVSDAVKASVRDILENYIEPLINVDFVEVSDAGSDYGQIRYMNSNGPGYAYAYGPFTHPLGGDIHFNPFYDNDFTTNGFQGGPGTHGFMALIHETLHALGLKHPGNYNGSGTGDPPFLPLGEDNTTNTLMSYNFAGNSAATPMAYDIKTLQYLYGAKPLNDGDTVYTFDSVYGYSDGSRSWGSASTPMKLTLVDTGGVDRLDFSNLAFAASGYRFDLRDGGILTAQQAHNTTAYRAVGDNSGTFYFTSTYGTTLAEGTTIEQVMGSQSGDTIFGNEADNLLMGNGGNDTLTGGAGDDSLLGGAGDDSLSGDAGDDVLDGGSGIDSLSGGDGDDRYIVDGTDVITELANQGLDRVEASSNYRLGANLENLTLTGTATQGAGNALDNQITGNHVANFLWGEAGDDSLSGNAGADLLNGGTGDDTLLGGTGGDQLYGDAGDDQLYGESGNDMVIGGMGDDLLVGGIGNDMLMGGADADVFAFNSWTEGIDTLMDFSQLDGDVIQLSAAGFGGGLTAGLLTAGQFVLGAAATDADDRLIYNGATGGLFFDADGTGGSAQVQFATLASGLGLQNTDFVLV